MDTWDDTLVTKQIKGTVVLQLKRTATPNGFGISVTYHDLWITMLKRICTLDLSRTPIYVVKLGFTLVLLFLLKSLPEVILLSTHDLCFEMKIRKTSQFFI